MARRSDTQLQARILAVRDLQRIAAEREAARTANALREKMDKAQGDEVRLLETERAWLECFAGGTIDLSAVSYWSGDAAAKRKILSESNAAVVEARMAFDRQAASWHLAIVRRDLAQRAHKRALRAAERRREEERLNEAADRAAAKAVLR